MKIWTLLFIFLITPKAYSMNILISYFDPFDGKSHNNSKNMAMLVASNLNQKGIKTTTCELRTVFDKAFDQLDDCIRSLEQRPDLVISLGEAGCKKVRLETRGINNDKSRGADNDGIERDNTPIYPDAPKYLGVKIPLEKAYCQLSHSEQSSFEISKSAGSFVCNNTLYHGLYQLDLPYTFIHVPMMSCTTEEKNMTLAKDLASYLEKMNGIDLMSSPQPIAKSEVKERLNENLSDCEKDFYKQLKKEY